MRRTTVSITIALLVLLTWSQTASAFHLPKKGAVSETAGIVRKVHNPDYFPLNKGSYWEYSFHSREAVGNNNIESKDQKIKMEVLSKTRSGQYYLVELKGDPIRFSPRGRFGLAVGIISKEVYYFDATQIHKLLAEKKKKNFTADSIPDYGSILFEFPLKDGQTYGAEDPERNDKMYRYAVNKISSYKTNNAKKSAAQYQITYACLADVLTYDFVPYVGITRVTYHHNGTLIDYDVKLNNYKIR